MNQLLHPIILPIIVGFICLILPNFLKKLIAPLAVLGSLATFIVTILIFLGENVLTVTPLFLLDNLSLFIVLGIGFFGFIMALYSMKFMAGKDRLREYYAYFLWTIGASIGAVLANNLILLLVFWGFLGLTLYLLIGIGGEKASSASKKTLIIIGASDSLMILGIGIVWVISKSFQISEITIPVVGSLEGVAFLCLAVAAFAKAGAMPVHSWVPDACEKAPVPVAAFLPASLDKLLGIYLLARVAMDVFVIGKALTTVLMIIGAFTIVAAVMMAMIQHDLKKLLGYHAVSQVGYMILGIGTGIPVGIAGGLFHMVNNSIYKSCLFLCGGAAEHRTGTSNLDKLGGLARFMPITFITCLIAALSISGVPPFNGFVSKWMVYQGLIEMGRQGDKLWIIWLVAAMFGSALTLASFMKIIHAVFLGQGKAEHRSIKEVSWTMWLPMAILALLCVVFGVFAFGTVLKYFIYPAVRGVTYTGSWQSGLATLLIIIGVVIGVVIYLLGKVKTRESSTYIGGEELPVECRVTGVDFYQTIQEIGLLGRIYKWAEAKKFDIYEQGSSLVFFCSGVLKKIHTGVLTNYICWILAGLVILFFILVK